MDLHRDMADRCFELVGLGRVDEAVDLAECAVQDDPDDGRFWQFLGLLRHRQGDYSGACAALETASLLVLLEPASRCALAECRCQGGAQRIGLRPVPPARPGRAVSHGFALGRRRRPGSLGENEAALAACRKIVRRDPLHHHAHFGVAFYLRRLGRPLTSVIASITRLHELAPRSPSTGSAWPCSSTTRASVRKPATCSVTSTRPRCSAAPASSGPCGDLSGGRGLGTVRGVPAQTDAIQKPHHHHP